MKFIEHGYKRKMDFPEIEFKDLFFIFQMHTKLIQKYQFKFISILYKKHENWMHINIIFIPPGFPTPKPVFDFLLPVY